MKGHQLGKWYYNRVRTLLYLLLLSFITYTIALVIINP